MDQNDDILRLAAALTEEPKPRAELVQALSSVGRAPLAALIDRFLLETPRFKLAVALKSIADKNQGNLDDLDSPDFQSYLISRLKISESDLRICCDALATFKRVSESNPSGSLGIAARGPMDTQSKVSDAKEILDNLKRRR
jgi:hypothetical protein